MTDISWYDILSRTTPKRPVQLDDLISGDQGPKPHGIVVFPEMSLIPSVALWERDEGGPTHIGVRIVSPMKSVYNVARFLAAAALEREVYPVILSRIDYSGFEQFGFRVERVPDEPMAAQFAEEEIRKFWDLAIIIDGDDIGLWAGQKAQSQSPADNSK
ncbi:hypothetical protein [Ruegeria arenilitoris]|uniref:hypothetical protein n=1 Tax=Ruegeria arenilitoris TaxID=1173585 RepID=UPI001479A34A|nr:hypothetical protein [Ruegeria arenilitoris]